MNTKQKACCPECGLMAESDDTPVTIGGWYGGIEYDWGQYAGVHSCRAVRYRCGDCAVEWSAEPNWDEY
jgi:hypothetical protein